MLKMSIMEKDKRTIFFMIECFFFSGKVVQKYYFFCDWLISAADLYFFKEVRGVLYQLRIAVQDGGDA